MGSADSETVTRLLHAVRAHDRAAFDRLFSVVYEELHALAERRRRRWSGDETLDTTVLVHEAYLRLVDQSEPPWETRAHFLAVAATAMRQILLDYSKRRRATKRGGGARRVPLDELEGALRVGGDLSEAGPEALIALDESLRRLEVHDAGLSRVVECRFFGGMTIEETAEALDISPATVKRRWAIAQPWLYRDLRRRAPSAP